ncbi:MAG: 50S ribosomal protein L24 [Candidatus Aenigmarchaeota archaeon]|nr:50S ribosomal protein L24 [Candidatus Aenigmarchaeota archaeon]
MKKEFSKNWNKSKQPRKQRKYVHNATTNIKRRLLGCNLSKALQNIYKRRSFTLKKGDRVKVLRGANKGKTGEVTKISVKDTKIYIAGLVTKKVNGTEVQVPFHPSSLQITELDLKDVKREKTIKKKETKTEEKTIKKKETKKE